MCIRDRIYLDLGNQRSIAVVSFIRDTGDTTTAYCLRPRNVRSERTMSLHVGLNFVVEIFQSVSVHCSNHSPRGILIHPMEDLCLGLLLAPLLRPGSLCSSHCSSRHRLCLFLSALPLPLRAKYTYPYQMHGSVGCLLYTSRCV